MIPMETTTPADIRYAILARENGLDLKTLAAFCVLFNCAPEGTAILAPAQHVCKHRTARR
jgi:hypothetical protein